MEESHMFLIVLLQSHYILLEPTFECLGRIFRKDTTMIYLQRSIHHHFHRFQRQCGIYHRSESRCHSAHEIRIGQHDITQCRFFLAIFDACQLNDVSNLHIRRASHFTTFTIQTIFQRLIKIFTSFQAKALLVRTSLLRTGILGVHRNNRTIHCTNSTFYALLKIVLAYIVLLHIHDLIHLLSYPLHIMP